MFFNILLVVLKTFFFIKLIDLSQISVSVHFQQYL